MNRFSSFGAGIALSVVFVAVVLDAASADDVRLVSSSSVLSRTPGNEELGDFYVLQFAPPDDLTLREFEEALLEFYVDASTALDAGSSSGQALIEVYLLTGNVAGDVSREDLNQGTRMVRNVRTGENRLVRLNITQAIKEILTNPSSNHGLVIGSLTGGRNGLFELRRHSFGPNDDARIVYSRIKR